ncbi:MAG TPA: N(4)-(beta-N-acetylglucosaminyl)-L-asparaginase [Kofleriaceae bacterium]|nr:N(4)-(beta-N-acetylglucosaminyl)-L-asparaginase [Kofleriaceae bacterium]
MARSRREFLRDASIAVALLPTAARAQSKAPVSAPAPAPAPPPAKPAPKPPDLPLVIATWDYGTLLCARAQQVFARGGDLLDALEQGVNAVEDDPSVSSVGFNGLPNADGVVQLDASIMDGRTHQSGSVAALERIKNPISVARKVMEKTRHVLLVGAGANAFARKLGFKEQDLMSPEARRAWEQRAKDPKASFWRDGSVHDTVCAIAMNGKGDLASAVSTSGLAGKLAGRVGDSPIIGAGNYCDNDVGAACATGIGELAIRNAASFAIVERMRAGVDPTRACQEILERMLKKSPEVRTDPAAQLAFIAMNKAGEVGAAALRLTKKPFRYALARGTKQAPALVDVKPML